MPGIGSGCDCLLVLQQKSLRAALKKVPGFQVQEAGLPAMALMVKRTSVSYYRLIIF